MWVCRLPVHIGPLGSSEFAKDYHKNGAYRAGRCGHRPLHRNERCIRMRHIFSQKSAASCRADRVVRPYTDLEILRENVGTAVF